MRTLTITILTLLVNIVLMVNAQRRQYDNYAVYGITASTAKELNIIKDFENSPEDYVFLDVVQQMGKPIKIVVSPMQKKQFLAKLQSENIKCELLEENAKEQLEEDQQEIADSNTRASEYNWTKYHALNDTYNWLEHLSEKFENQVETFIAGQTYEKRSIMGIKISFGKQETKRAVFLEGGMHAREWISPATTTYIANEILHNENEQVRQLVEQFDWYIVPHTNPDGYVYTHTTDRLWRKTRTPYGKCFGADPNRNWNNHWNEVGASSNPCSDTYAGPAAFSEVETRTLADYLKKIENEIFLYVSFHAYSQLLLFPYGYTNQLPANYKHMKRIYDVATEKLRQRYGTRYTGGNIYDAIYPASGSTVDYAYEALNINYSYCYELRPSSNSYWTGFKLPANQIIPTGEETFDSLLAMLQEANVLSKT